MLEDEKTWVFWVGLIIFALACIEVFSVLWMLSVSSPVYIESALKVATPYIVGGVVFIIVGFYMMNSGVKKKPA